MKQGVVISIIIVVSIVVLGAIFFFPSSSQEQINSFEECAAAGNAIMESYPRQCRSASGQLFVEEIEEPTSNDSGSAGGTQPAGQTPETEFVMEADDNGFYINGEDIDSISASLGSEISITFNVRTTNVYYAGLDFKGCGIDSGKINPGESTTEEFTMENACTITSYWPSSGIVKDRLQVLVD